MCAIEPSPCGSGIPRLYCSTSPTTSQKFFEIKHLETEHLCRLNLLTPMSDQERISPYTINTSDEGKVICQSWDCWLIQYQIQQTNNIRIA